MVPIDLEKLEEISGSFVIGATIKSHLAPTWATTHAISHGGGSLAPHRLIACVVAHVATKLDDLEKILNLTCQCAIFVIIVIFIKLSFPWGRY